MNPKGLGRLSLIEGRITDKEQNMYQKQTMTKCKLSRLSPILSRLSWAKPTQSQGESAKSVGLLRRWDFAELLKLEIFKYFLKKMTQ